MYMTCTYACVCVYIYIYIYMVCLLYKVSLPRPLAGAAPSLRRDADFHLNNKHFKRIHLRAEETG